MRLIDADALKLYIDKEVAEDKVLAGWAFFFKAYLDDAPAIDIVRCEECKHYAEHNELYINAPTNCVKHSTINHYVVVNADDYCSYGERSSDDDKRRNTT